MKNKKVVMSDRRIYLESNPRSIVMDIGSKPLTEIYSDIGFGMGFSANKMSELSETYTCIEINPQIYETAIQWANDKPNVEIIFGDWVDVIPTLNKKFDGIFMDTHDDENYRKFEEYASIVSKEGTILSIFNYFDLRDRSELNEYVCKMDSLNFAKVVNGIHYVNWTYFKNGNFEKGSNKIKSKQTHLI